MARKQLLSLTATRGIAALLVVVFHFGLNCTPFNDWQRFFSKGNLAVSYFFTLSGFIMCYTYANADIVYGEYIRKRMARIVPVYMMALLLSILFACYDANVNHKAYEPNFLKGILLNFGLLQAYVPGYALSVNSPGWSLSVEMFFYLLFPVLLLLYERNARYFFIGALLLWIVSQLSHVWLLSTGRADASKEMQEFIYYFPLNHFNEFVLGMAGYYLLQKDVGWIKYAYPIVLFIVICISVVYLPLSKHNGLLSPLFVLMIVGLAARNTPLFGNPALVYFGEISYSLYILQMPVFLIMAEVNRRVLLLSENSFFYMTLIVLLLSSAMCYRYVEKPLRKKISGTA